MERNFRLVYSDSSLQFCSVLFVCFTQNQDCNSGMLFWVALLRFQILSVIVFASLRCQNGIVQFLWFTQTPDSISGVFCLFYSDSILQIWSILFVCFTQALDLDCSFLLLYSGSRCGVFFLILLFRRQIWIVYFVWFTQTPDLWSSFCLLYLYSILQICSVLFCLL